MSTPHNADDLAQIALWKMRYAGACRECERLRGDVQRSRDSAEAAERERLTKLKHDLHDSEGSLEWRAGYKLGWRQCIQAIRNGE